MARNVMLHKSTSSSWAVRFLWTEKPFVAIIRISTWQVYCVVIKQAGKNGLANVQMEAESALFFFRIVGDLSVFLRIYSFL